MTMNRIDTHGHVYESYPDLSESVKKIEKINTFLEHQAGAILAEGCRVLYGVDVGTYLRADAPELVFRKAKELRAAGKAQAISQTLDRARILQQLIFTNTTVQSKPFASLGKRVRYLAYIDSGIGGQYNPDFPFRKGHYYDELCKMFGPLQTLDEYLAALQAAIGSWRANNVVGLKCSFAYTTGLNISDPLPRDAVSAFNKKEDMTEAEFRTVHDFAFRYALDLCKGNGFPVVFHTGIMNWGHSDLRQANPMHLHNLLIDKRYKDVTFVILHGGNPYVGETTYLAGMFPKVFIDFTWISWMSRIRFRNALAEWLEVVPHNRLCWGSDSGCPESIAGIDHITRTEIANVLEELIQSKIIDERTALSFLENAYLHTPRRIFRL